MISRRELYAAGEPFGDSATYMEAGRMVCGGGGGSSAPQTSVTTQEIPAELKPLAKAYTDKAINLSNQSYQPYTGQRYADLNATQNAGIGMTQNRALNGDATIDSGANFLQNQLNSGTAMATMNPYGGVRAGMNYNQITPGVNNSQVSAGSNPYAEQTNPYLDQMVAQAQNQVKQNFMNSAINSGSFGNSGLQQQYGLGLANIATNMYGNAYNTQAQLKADDLNRSLNAQQFNSGVIDNNIARNMQAQQFNSGITDSNLARNLNAQQFNSNLGNDWASRNDSMYNNSMSQKLNAANLGLNYGNQAYTDASKLMQAGQVQQDQAQNNLDYRYGQYQDQQNLPYRQLASMAGVFGSNLGGTSTTTSSGGGGK